LRKPSAFYLKLRGSTMKAQVVPKNSHAPGSPKQTPCSHLFFFVARAFFYQDCGGLNLENPIRTSKRKILFLWVAGFPIPLLPLLFPMGSAVS
jgi:hypothetical protein